MFLVCTRLKQVPVLLLEIPSGIYITGNTDYCQNSDPELYLYDGVYHLTLLHSMFIQLQEPVKHIPHAFKVMDKI